MFDVTGITYFLQSVILITSICCVTLLDGAANTTMSYDPGELLSKILNLKDESRSRNEFRFEGQNDPNNYNYANEDIAIDRPIYLPSADNVNQNAYNNHKLTYPDDNQISGSQKKRRRKQKYQKPQGLGPQYLGPHGPIMLQLGITNPYIDFQGPIYRPTNPPKASFASETLSMVTEALTSTALYDDLQCVPRLLCEAASGGALGSSQTLQSISGLQPLLTLLSAYGGVSSNPLFVFGRAAILGISSKNNPSSCRYAYPLCPTDPEKLVFYLNNHNGGFFRFFNAPQRGPHNVDQFYGELSQNYGNSQHLSPFQHNGVNNNLYQNQYNQNYNVQNYGLNYPYKQDKYGLLNNIRFKNNYESNETFRIEKRIQNRPGKYLDNDEDLNVDNVYYQTSKWSFPETDNSIMSESYRKGKGLRFPENFKKEYNIYTFKRDPRGFVFPESTTEDLHFNKYQVMNPLSHTHNTYDNFYNNAETYKVQNPDEYNKEQSIRTVYVVRGNGDPRRPEIIKLGPGQSVH